MLYASNLFNSLIFASLLFVKLLMFLLKNSFDDKYFLKIMVDNWGVYSKWIEWMGFLNVVWLWRISVGYLQEMMGLVLEGLLFYILSIHIPSNDFSVFVEIYDVPRSIVCCTILEQLFGMWSTLWVSPFSLFLC